MQQLHVPLRMMWAWIDMRSVGLLVFLYRRTGCLSTQPGQMGVGLWQ